MVSPFGVALSEAACARPVGLVFHPDLRAGDAAFFPGYRRQSSRPKNKFDAVRTRRRAHCGGLVRRYSAIPPSLYSFAHDESNRRRVGSAAFLSPPTVAARLLRNTGVRSDGRPCEGTGKHPAILNWAGSVHSARLVLHDGLHRSASGLLL